MTTGALYAALNQKIPVALSCDWDNDGLMCCPDTERKAARVLVALDITAEVVSRATEGGYDVIVSHHPLIFSPLRSVHPNDPVAAKVIRLLQSGITAMSFHTRLDAVEGGVNDVLATALGLREVVPFGEEAIGRIGVLPEAISAEEFARLAKRVLGADQILLSDAGRAVRRVAVLGGGGSSDVGEAIRAGADTYLTGELKHNYLADAPELGINLLAGGHFHTENLICQRIREMLLEIDPSLVVDVISSNAVRVL